MSKQITGLENDLQQILSEDIPYLTFALKILLIEDILQTSRIFSSQLTYIDLY